MNVLKIWFIALLTLTCYSCMLPAEGVETSNVPVGKKEFEVWTDISFDTTTIGSLTSADVSGRKLGIVGLRYSQQLNVRESLSVSYTLDVIPVAIAFSSQINSSTGVLIRDNVYGWGVSPIGFSFQFLPSNKLHPFLNMAGGFLYFEKPVPSPDGTRWNYTATAGGGIRFPISNFFFDAGYMFHHISNGKGQLQNPSLNTHIIYMGFVVWSR
jgi:Lipid A 3-O-deacylase (PagL)